MTVESIYVPVSYRGNGATVAFGFPFQFFAPSDLIVRLLDLSTNTPVAPPLLNGAAAFDYAVTGTIDDEGTGEYLNGTVIFNTAPPANFRITIERSVAALQSVSLSDDSLFPAKSVEAELDRLQMQIQQGQASAQRAITAPASDGPVNLVLPPFGVRAEMLLSFDDGGNVETVISKGAVQAAIAAIDAGIAPAPTTASWATTLAAAVVLYAAPVLLADGQAMVVAGRNAVHDGYEGTFVYKAADAISTFPQSGRGFVDAAGRRWFRAHPKGLVSALWYGAWGDGAHDDYAPIQAAVDDMRGQGQSTVLLPFGIYMNNTQAWNFSGVSVEGFSRIGSILLRGPAMPDLYLWKLDSATDGGAVSSRYRNFRSDGNTAGNANANWVIGVIGNALFNTFDALDIINFKTGAMRWVGAYGFRPNINKVNNCSFRDGDGDGVEIRAGGVLDFKSLNVEQIGGSFFKVSGGDEPVGPVTVENFWFEVSGDGAIDGVIVDCVDQTIPFNTSSGVVLRQGRIVEYGNSAGTAGNGINLLRSSRATLDGIAIAPRAGVSGPGHRKIAISANSGSNVVKNINLTDTDVDNQSGSTVFENCNFGYARLTFCNLDAVPAGANLSYGPATTGGTPAGQRRMRWGGYDAIAGMYVNMGPLPGPGQQYVFTIIKNGLGTSLSLVLVDGDGGWRSGQFSIPMTPQDTIELSVISSAGAAIIPASGFVATLLIYK